jgi:hypothetical protein
MNTAWFQTQFSLYGPKRKSSLATTALCSFSLISASPFLTPSSSLAEVVFAFLDFYSSVSRHAYGFGHVYIVNDPPSIIYIVDKLKIGKIV